MTRFALLLLLLTGIAGAVSGQSAPAVREGFATTEDGLRLHYSVHGDGPQTVLIPAGLYLQRDLQELARGRRVVFYDMRGRGRSDRVADTSHITIEWDVRDMESVRRAVSAERVTVVGWSYLGFMVMLYAVEHPQNVERIVQIGPVPRRWNTRFPPELMASTASNVDSATAAELARIRAVSPAQRNTRADCDKEYELSRAQLVGSRELANRVPNVCEFPNEWPGAFSRHLRHHFVGSVQNLDVPWERFARVTVPVLTIHGTNDRNAAYGAGREWVSRLTNARLLTVTGAAHLPWIDQPRLVFSAMDTFLRGNWPAQAARVE